MFSVLKIDNPLFFVENSLPSFSEMEATIHALERMASLSVRGKFEWIDGLLLEAIETGHWLLIDNANFCHGIFFYQTC